MTGSILDRTALLVQNRQVLQRRLESLRGVQSPNWTTYSLAGDETIDIADTAIRKAWGVIDRLIQLADAEIARAVQP